MIRKLYLVTNVHTTTQPNNTTANKKKQHHTTMIRKLYLVTNIQTHNSIPNFRYLSCNFVSSENTVNLLVQGMEVRTTNACKFGAQADVLRPE